MSLQWSGAQQAALTCVRKPRDSFPLGQRARNAGGDSLFPEALVRPFFKSREHGAPAQRAIECVRAHTQASTRRSVCEALGNDICTCSACRSLSRSWCRRYNVSNDRNGSPPARSPCCSCAYDQASTGRRQRAYFMWITMGCGINWT
eukprot:IDg17127t1